MVLHDFVRLKDLVMGPQPVKMHHLGVDDTVSPGLAHGREQKGGGNPCSAQTGEIL